MPVLAVVCAIRQPAFYLIVALAALAGCAGGGPEVGGEADTGGRPSGGGQVGLASYYADRFEGRPTASGELFDQEKMTAAHRTLPFGTMVRVTRLDDGRAVIVRVNDRGPFVTGRIIDLSRRAAEQLGMIAEGVVRVRVEVTGGDPDF